jgi:hypothetical protein
VIIVGCEEVQKGYLLFFMVREVGYKDVNYLFFPKQHLELAITEDFSKFVPASCNLKPAT